jgi:hypothetical protein
MIITQITPEQEAWARGFARHSMRSAEVKAYNRRNGTLYRSVAELLKAEPGEDVFKFYRESWVAELERRTAPL